MTTAVAMVQPILGEVTSGFLEAVHLDGQDGPVEVGNLPFGFVRYTCAQLGLSSAFATTVLATIGLNRGPPDSTSPNPERPWSSRAPRPEPNRSWIELASAGHVVPAQVFAQALRLVSQEAKAVKERNESVKFAPGLVIFTFEQRALVSICAHLVSTFPLDQSVGASSQPAWTGAPCTLR